METILWMSAKEARDQLLLKEKKAMENVCKDLRGKMDQIIHGHNKEVVKQ